MSLLLLLPFVNTLVMSAIKWAFDKKLREKATRNWRLRLVLIILSLGGVVASSAMNNTPIDSNTVTDLVRAFLEVVSVALASHFSYKVIKSA